MTFNEYQTLARQTAIYPGRMGPAGLGYATLGLNGEAGEVAEKVKKILRDCAGQANQDHVDAIAKELGDVFWYCSAIADEMGLSLENIAQENITKLQSRHERGMLHGSGDDR